MLKNGERRLAPAPNDWKVLRMGLRLNQAQKTIANRHHGDEPLTLPKGTNK
jgi:hypothetical protein